MMKYFKIIAFYQIHNVIRSRWLSFYFIFFFGLSYSFLNFSSDNSKAILNIINISLFIVPLVSILFGSIYTYNAREFIELMLCQPISRKTLLLGLYSGITSTLSFVYLAGVIIPVLIFSPSIVLTPVFYLLLVIGVTEHFIFSAYALLLTTLFDDRAKGLGALLVTWLFMSIIYDGLLLSLIFLFQDYPLEIPLISLTVINPIDLGRILFMLQFDNSALMGFTGAVFKNFFGSFPGKAVCFVSLSLWVAAPLLMAVVKFRKKDF